MCNTFGKDEELILLFVRCLMVGYIGNIKNSLALSLFYLSMSSHFFGIGLLSEMGCLAGGGMC